MQNGNPSHEHKEEGKHVFHRQIAAALQRSLGALLVAALLWAPVLGRAAGTRPWILVDTRALVLTVFSADDRVLARFDNISIGSGGAAEIRRRGDESTPLGVFHVAWIDRRSRYGTFYGIDYPSVDVARRALAQGVISRAQHDAILASFAHGRLPPQNTPLGGRLGIHGIGRGDPRIHAAFNWTDGCVALNNAQLARLSHWVRIGTRVEIR